MTAYPGLLALVMLLPVRPAVQSAEGGRMTTWREKMKADHNQAVDALVQRDEHFETCAAMLAALPQHYRGLYFQRFAPDFAMVVCRSWPDPLRLELAGSDLRIGDAVVNLATRQPTHDGEPLADLGAFAYEHARVWLLAAGVAPSIPT